MNQNDIIVTHEQAAFRMKNVLSCQIRKKPLFVTHIYGCFMGDSQRLFPYIA